MGRKALHLTLLAALAAFAWVAAPALSMNPYLAEPVDFEQRLSGVERTVAGLSGLRAKAADEHSHAGEVGHGPVSHLSDVIEAPERFDLVGLTKEKRPLELRAREDGAEWSDWIETANGDPVYFGGADEVQLRTRGWRPSGELHYVNVSGTTSPEDSLLNGARRAINGAFISVASIIQPEADAEATKPDVINRREWGGKTSCKPRGGKDYGRVKAAVVHHTVTSGSYSEEEAPGIVLGICRFHRDGNGWNDIGYNALVDNYGNIYAGRAGGLGKAVVGAHAQGFNAQTTGVAAIGTHTTKPITPASLTAFADFIAWKLSHHGKKARGKARLRSAGGSVSKYRAGKRVKTKRVFGHRRVNSTACPGNALKRQVKKIRRYAQARIDGSEVKEPPEEEDPEPPPDIPPIVPGDSNGGVRPSGA